MSTVEIAPFTRFIPEEVRPYEMAARIYMKKKGGIDPESDVPRAHPTIEGVLVYVPAWCFVAQELIDLSMMLNSIREANQTNMVPQ